MKTDCNLLAMVETRFLPESSACRRRLLCLKFLRANELGAMCFARGCHLPASAIKETQAGNSHHLLRKLLQNFCSYECIRRIFTPLRESFLFRMSGKVIDTQIGLRIIDAVRRSTKGLLWIQVRRILGFKYAKKLLHPDLQNYSNSIDEEITRRNGME